MRDDRGEFGLINVHLFDILPAILSEIFYVSSVVTLICPHHRSQCVFI